MGWILMQPSNDPKSVQAEEHLRDTGICLLHLSKMVPVYNQSPSVPYVVRIMMETFIPLPAKQPVAAEPLVCCESFCGDATFIGYAIA